MGAERAPLLLDRYVLHDEIASGGMAAVHFGQVLGAAGFARTVAIKRLHPQFAKDPEFVTMFLDEARLAARVRHPNVVGTLDVVSTADELFLVMEYVPGESLSSLIRASKQAGERLPPPVVSGILGGALLGLHAAHEALTEDGHPLGIVHRDVSPHNLLVGQDGVARVLDFGVARATVRSGVTREGQLKGKLRYMAPEQLGGATATRRADLYAASVVLWEGLTGERLFDGETDAMIYGRVLEGVVQPPSRFVPIGPHADAVVMRGLARDPSQRWATALEMAAALERAIPPAGAREIAAWLEAVAGPVLSKRSRRVQVIEGRRASMASLPPPVIEDPATQTATHTDARAGEASAVMTIPDSTQTPVRSEPPARPSTTQTFPHGEVRAPGRIPSAGLAAGAVAALVVGGVAAFAILGGARAGAVTSARRGLGSAALLASLRERSAAIALAEARAVEPAPSAEAPPAPSAAPALKKTPARPAARSACDPPYYLDASGIRRVKRECL